MSKITTAPLSALRPGAEYPGGSINSRKYTPAEVADMESLLLGHGLLQSLLVKSDPARPNVFYVGAGNRRTAALLSLLKKKMLGKIPDFDPEAVPIIVRDDLSPAQFLAKSMVENTGRIPLHPVDRFHTFSEMLSRGMNVEAIAAELQTTPRVVNQALALAALSKKSREAYLAGKLNARQAEALTVTKDHAAQDRVLKSINEHTRSSEIRSRLVGDVELMAPMLAYVGEEAYAAAGGQTHKDLFTEKDDAAGVTVLDPALLTKLAAKKLTPLVAKLKSEGWKWAAPAMELSSRYWRDWATAAGGKNCKPGDKKLTGVVISFRKDGTLDYTYGVLHRDDGYSLRNDASKVKKNKEKPKPGAKPLVSAALMRDMSTWLTQASAEALIAHNDTKLLHALILAGANGAGFSKAVDIKVNGLSGKVATSSRTYRDNNKPFAPLFAEMMKPGAEKQRATLLAELVARSFDFQVFSGTRPPLKEPAYAAVVNALHGPDLLAQLTAQLVKNAPRYFGGAGKRSNIDAIKEALGADTARQVGKGTGKTISAFAAKHVPPTGWLPEQLRPAAYKAPAAKAPVIVAAPAVAKKSKKR